MRRVVMILILLVLASLFALTWVNVRSAYAGGPAKSKESQLFSVGSQQADDGIEIDATVVALDPGKGDATVRLTFTPFGKMMAEDEVTLSHPVLVSVNSVTGKAEYNFKKHETMGPVEFTTSLGGSSATYPFDEHPFELSVDVMRPVFEADAPKDAPPSDFESVHVIANGYGKVSGFSLVKVPTLNEKGKEMPDADDHGNPDITLKATRSPMVVKFACFIMTLEWGLALGCLFVTLSVVVGGRKAELPFFAWMTTLLFALPPLRNIMVGAPAIGIYSDFLAFLWCEGLVGFCLMSVVVTWLLRRP